MLMFLLDEHPEMELLGQRWALHFKVSDEQHPNSSKLNVKMETEFVNEWWRDKEGERAGPMGSVQETGAEWMGGESVENWYEVGWETEDPAWEPPLPSLLWDPTVPGNSAGEVSLILAARKINKEIFKNSSSPGNSDSVV